MEPTGKTATSSGPKPNKQLFGNSGLAELFADQRASTNPLETFFNQRDPNLAVLHEKPEHRVLLMLKLRGMSNREISKEMGYTEPWLSQIFRQPWAVQTMAKLATEAGTESLQRILESEAVPTIMKLVELRDDADTPAAVVRATCDSLLDRYLGKPQQHVEVVQKTAAMDVESVEELDKEIAALRQEEKNLLGHN